MTTDSEQRAEGVKRNCVDSVRHALEHFSANSIEEHGFHNQKWAILSVAHAVEAFCNLLIMMTIDRNHPNGLKYPDLTKALNRLKSVPDAPLTGSERYAVRHIFPGLAVQRNELMHRDPKLSLDLRDTALALLALLDLMRRRIGVYTEDLFDQSPPIERDLFEELGLKGLDVWGTLAEKLVQEEYGKFGVELGSVVHCGYCGQLTLTDSGCWTCFDEDVDRAFLENRD